MPDWALWYTRALKRLLPRGLLGRSLLIMLVPLVLVQAVALQVFYGTHMNIVSRRLAGAIAGEIAVTVEMLETYPDPKVQTHVLTALWDRLELAMAVRPGVLVPEFVRPPPLLLLERNLALALEERVRRKVAMDWQSDENAVLIRVQMRDGVLEVAAPRKRLFSGTLYLFVLWLVGSSALVFGIAALFMRNQVRSIRRLAAAVDEFGKGRDPPPVKPSGAIEVRLAANAFNAMQERVRRFLGQRTQMLAGVSHDLRTPLTRMRLTLAMLPVAEESRQDIADLTADLEEMDRMIGGYLAFARGVGEERSEPTDLSLMLSEVAARARRSGAAVALSVPEDLVLPLRADAFRRAVTNLVDNARRHAKHVTLAARAMPAAVEVTVDDDGPGIAADRHEEVFRAFEAGPGGGTGLGMTIARDIVRAHGGEIALETAPLGGLRVRVTLPV